MQKAGRHQSAGQRECGPASGPDRPLGERRGRPDTNEGIPGPDTLLGRLEEVGARQVRRQLGVETDGAFAVGEKAAKDRNYPACDGELAELLQRGERSLIM